MEKKKTKKDEPFNLNPQDLEILVMLSKGHNLDSIVDELNIQLDTVRKRLTRIRLRMGARTRAQMMFEFGKFNKQNPCK